MSAVILPAYSKAWVPVKPTFDFAAYAEAVGLLASDHWLQKDLHERIVALYRSQNRLADLAQYCQQQIARAPEQTAMRVLLADVQAFVAQGVPPKPPEPEKPARKPRAKKK